MTDRSLPWHNRIVRYGVQSADQFLAHPLNPNFHPIAQQEATKGSLDTLGWIKPVIVSSSGYLIDGHDRIYHALEQGDQTPVPFVEVDLQPHEEHLALAILDNITRLAVTDHAHLDELIAQIDTDNAVLNALLVDLARASDLPADTDWSNAFDALPDEDRVPFQQMTFTLHDTQIDVVKRAIALAHDAGRYTGPNENSNGNALARICEAYLNEQR